MKFATKAVHAGEEPDLDSGSGDVVIPIHLSATFARKDVDKPTRGYEYSRTGNPTRHALEVRLAALEDSKYALAFASGLAAETTLALTVLRKGDHVVASDDLYGGTRRLFVHTLSRFGVSISFVDARLTSRVMDGFRKNTKMVWLETPTNPLLTLSDIRALSRVAKRRGAITVVDNTFMSPYFQNPLKLGADVAVHSVTKFISGHSDSVGGALMLSDKKLYEELRFNQNALGAILSPFDSFLALRGSKTLPLRMERHQENAMKIAKFLLSHPKAKNVRYPGLKIHPQFNLAKRQMKGFGGMLSFDVDGGLPEVRRFLGRVKIFALAESLGGVESLVEHPASMTHASVPRGERVKLGITDNLVRLSVGIEDADDLIHDLAVALG
ncbi:MAG: PLP-dependent aspartate aminotransferase family protein [Thaumarchaeota archaeon]|nr:PLP-dependent aspartate aminotransferase family protein [Nitrososphaerota archaeon]